MQRLMRLFLAHRLTLRQSRNVTIKNADGRLTIICISCRAVFTRLATGIKRGHQIIFIDSDCNVGMYTMGADKISQAVDQFRLLPFDVS